MGSRRQVEFRRHCDVGERSISHVFILQHVVALMKDRCRDSFFFDQMQSEHTHNRMRSASSIAVDIWADEMKTVIAPCVVQSGWVLVRSHEWQAIGSMCSGAESWDEMHECMSVWYCTNQMNTCSILKRGAIGSSRNKLKKLGQPQHRTGTAVNVSQRVARKKVPKRPRQPCESTNRGE